MAQRRIPAADRTPARTAPKRRPVTQPLPEQEQYLTVSQEQPATRTAKESEVLAALRAEVEGFEHTDEVWGSVYIDNAKPDAMSPRAFAGVLAALERKGLYRSQGDDAFGYVRMPPKAGPTPHEEDCTPAENAAWDHLLASNEKAELAALIARIQGLVPAKVTYLLDPERIATTADALTEPEARKALSALERAGFRRSMIDQDVDGRWGLTVWLPIAGAPDPAIARGAAVHAMAAESFVPTEAEVEACKREIGHLTDGPLTAFVLMSRATRYAARTGRARTAANALDELLTEGGFLRARPARSNGS